jgi:hypothetical protein
MWSAQRARESEGEIAAVSPSGGSSERREDLAHAAEEDQVPVIGVVDRSHVLQASLLRAGHLDRVIAVRLAVPDQHLGLDLSRLEAFAARDGDAIPGCWAVPLPERLREAKQRAQAARTFCALRQRGRFSRSYVDAGPECTRARAALFSSRYGARNAVSAATVSSGACSANQWPAPGMTALCTSFARGFHRLPNRITPDVRSADGKNGHRQRPSDAGRPLHEAESRARGGAAPVGRLLVRARGLRARGELVAGRHLLNQRGEHGFIHRREPHQTSVQTLQLCFRERVESTL